MASFGLGPLVLLALAAGCEAPDRLALLILAPSGELGHVRSAELISFVDRTVDSRTDLELDRIDPLSVAGCRGRVSCFVQTARPDYDRRVYFRPRGGVAPFEEHLEYVELRDLSVARFMLLASGVGTPSGDALTFTLVDLDAALAWRHEHEQLDRSAEISLLRAATLGQLRAEVTAPSELEPVLAQVRDELLKPALKARDHWDPFGRLIIEANVPGAGVYVNDRLVATTQNGPVTVDWVKPGRVRVRIEHPDYRPLELEAEVRRAEPAQTTVLLERRPAASGRIVHAATFWTGLALVGAGIALVVAGAVDAENAPELACTDCSGGFRRISTADPVDPTQPPEESGPLTVPLGYSLALTGATWSVGSRFTDRDRVPWLPLLAGLAAGGVAYGVSEAAR